MLTKFGQLPIVCFWNWLIAQWIFVSYCMHTSLSWLCVGHAGLVMRQLLHHCQQARSEAEIVVQFLNWVFNSLQEAVHFGGWVGVREQGFLPGHMHENIVFVLCHRDVHVVHNLNLHQPISTKVEYEDHTKVKHQHSKVVVNKQVFLLHFGVSDVGGYAV